EDILGSVEAKRPEGEVDHDIGWSQLSLVTQGVEDLQVQLDGGAVGLVDDGGHWLCYLWHACCSSSWMRCRKYSLSSSSSTSSNQKRCDSKSKRMSYLR